jgi:hypothetical protein
VRYLVFLLGIGHHTVAEKKFANTAEKKFANTAEKKFANTIGVKPKDLMNGPKGRKTAHLNVIIVDLKSRRILRYEPFGTNQNDLRKEVVSVFDILFGKRFVFFQNSNSDQNEYEKNCANLCLNFVERSLSTDPKHS